MPVTDTILTPDEQNRWDLLVKERLSLQDNLKTTYCALEELFAEALKRVMQEGKWRITEWGYGLCALPADDKANSSLIRMGQAALHLDWHDTILLQAEGENIVVNFDDGDIAVALELYSKDPERITAFAKALKLDIDLTEWVAKRRAELVADLDSQIETLQKRREHYAR